MAPTQQLKEKKKKSESNNYNGTKQLLPPRSSSRFLGCFGYPCKYDDSSADKKAATESVRSKKAGGDKKKKKKRYHFKVSWSKFRLTIKKPEAPAPKKAALLVVPIDCNSSKSESMSVQSWKTRARELINRLSFSKTSSVTDLVVVVAKDPSFYDCQDRSKEESIINHLQEKENQSSSNVSRSQSDCRLSDKDVTITYKAAGSPDRPSKITATNKKRSGERHDRKELADDQMEHDKDSLIGISIVMVTLIIMLVWGRLCAILCTSAWFYCVPRFKGSSNKCYHVDCWVNKKHLDTVNSEMYKKKLILEGLLQRNHDRTSLR